MQKFTYKDIIIEEGKRMLKVDILPGKYCNFDCTFCPVGCRSIMTDKEEDFGAAAAVLAELGEKIDSTKAELVYINSNGESFVNNKLTEIINFVKSKGVPVRLLTNGYMLGWEPFMSIASLCDEVLGEVRIITEAEFKKVHRPIEGYTVAAHIENMAKFKKQYKGRFLLEITALKGYNDDEASVKQMKEIIEKIAPDKVIVERMDDDVFGPKFNVTDERFEAISKALIG